MVASYGSDAWKARFKPIADWDRMFAEGRWDYLGDVAEAPRYSLIAGYIHRRPGAVDVLDVGCGSGILLSYLDTSRIRYSGFDLSPAATAKARARFPKAEFDTATIEDYGLSGRSHDVIVFNEVLPHIADPLGCLERYLDHLAPGGVAIISTYQNPDRSSNAAMFTALLDTWLEQGRFTAITGCEVTSFDAGLKWRVDVIDREQSANVEV